MSIDKNDPRMQAAIEAYKKGDLRKEVEILEPLLQEHPDDADLLQRVGAALGQIGEFEKSESYLNRALEQAPANIQVVMMLAWIARRADNRAKTRRLVEKIIDLDPSNAEAHVDLGNFFLDDGDNASARASFEKALSLNENSINALTNLASLCEREHRFEDGAALAERAVQLAPDHGQANIVHARIALRTDRAKEAMERMQDLLARVQLSDFDSASCLYLIGQAADKLEEYEHAFVAFQSANNTFHDVYARSVASMDSVLAPASLTRIRTFFETEDVAGWTKPETLEGPTPVFLLGFPRSGTTLLDQILKTHSAIETMEENENFIDARNELIRPEGGLERLGAMSDEEINLYRSKYWSRVGEEGKAATERGLFIDKMPLNTILLGVIYRLFPDAKIIFALRDPRDVVLSCFQQRFGINVAMYQLLKLDAAAAYYDQTMQIGEICRTRLPLDIHTMRYEDVVADLKAAAMGVLDFLGLEWEDEILNYREQARERWIGTPSAEQVVEPVYTSSLGKWRRYEPYMSSALPALEPWVKKFGYDAE